MTIGTNNVSAVYLGTSEVLRITDQQGNVLYEVNRPQVEYLCFTANQANSTVGMTHNGTNQTSTKPVIYISTDKEHWTEWDYTTITLSNVGDKVYMYGSNQNGVSSSASNYSSFTMSGSVAASGDCTTLIAQQGSDTITFCGYYKLFQNCTALTTAPELPATNLASYCYQYMFSGCTALTTAPALPATTLADGCYYYMFSGCTALTTAPVLSATTMAELCYDSMFRDCTSLTTAPALPATTLGLKCYGNMFKGCTALTTAPALPATTLSNQCYQSMFEGCTSLVTAPELSATTVTVLCYDSMFSGCTSLASAPELPAATLASRCYAYMFYGCGQIDAITCLATDISATECTLSWVSGVAQSGTFTQADIMNSWTIGDSGVPTGWELLDKSPFFTITATSANTAVRITHSGTNQTTTKPVFYTSTNKTSWTQWDTDVYLQLPNVGDKVYLYGTNPNGIGRGQSNYSVFGLVRGAADIRGDITRLLSQSGDVNVPSYGFYQLFAYSGFGGRIQFGNIRTSITLANYSCTSMFEGCTNIVSADMHRIRSVGSNACNTMFNGCTSFNNIYAPTVLSINYTNWLQNVSLTGTFKIDNKNQMTRNTSCVPITWTLIQLPKRLTISAAESGDIAVDYTYNGTSATVAVGTTTTLDVYNSDTIVFNIPSGAQLIYGDDVPCKSCGPNNYTLSWGSAKEIQQYHYVLSTSVTFTITNNSMNDIDTTNGYLMSGDSDTVTLNCGETYFVNYQYCFGGNGAEAMFIDGVYKETDGYHEFTNYNIPDGANVSVIDVSTNYVDVINQIRANYAYTLNPCYGSSRTNNSETFYMTEYDTLYLSVDNGYHIYVDGTDVGHNATIQGSSLSSPLYVEINEFGVNVNVFNNSDGPIDANTGLMVETINAHEGNSLYVPEGGALHLSGSAQCYGFFLDNTDYGNPATFQYEDLSDYVGIEYNPNCQPINITLDSTNGSMCYSVCCIHTDNDCLYNDSIMVEMYDGETINVTSGDASMYHIFLNGTDLGDDATLTAGVDLSEGDIIICDTYNN